MNIIHDNIRALIIRKANIDRKEKGWGTVCCTELLNDGTWMCGLNIITSIDAVLDESEKKGIVVGFESHVRGDKW